MSGSSSHSQPVAGSAGASPVSSSAIDASCRLPLFVMFISGAIWLLIASVFGLIASIKLHQPAFLGDWAWLTYGRVRPVYYNALIYGFCVQTGLGVGLWIMAHLSRVELVGRWMITIGVKLWNLGVTVGVIGVLAGDGLGYDRLEMPGYAALLLFLGYGAIGLFGLLTFHRRRYFPLYVSHWFLVAALFWFPWIYSTAYLLIDVYPVRGIGQTIIAWWYASNLEVVWLGAVGLAAAFYLVPKLRGRELKSSYLALFTFWGLLLFGGWSGIPLHAPVPAWIPALSSSAAVLMLIPILTVVLNLYGTNGSIWAGPDVHVSLRFVCAGIAAYIAAELLRVLASFPQVATVSDLTWYVVAREHLFVYGFFAVTLFGAVYYIVPRLTGFEFKTAWIRRHLILAIAGVALIVLPLLIAGVAQGVKTRNPTLDFNLVIKATLPWLRASTLGDLLLAAGHLVFAMNIIGLVRKFLKARVTATYTTLTQEVKPAGAGA